MRNTDPDPKPFRPLGERVQAPPPPAPVLKPAQGPYGVVTGADGKMRTTKEPR